MKTKKIRILALAMALLTTLTACGQTAEPESSEPVAVLPGEELGIGDETVKSHVKSIYRKTAVHSQQELIDLLERESGVEG